jgi:hypothetical protein
LPVGNGGKSCIFSSEEIGIAADFLHVFNNM